MAISRLSLLVQADQDTASNWTLSTPVAAGSNRILVVCVHFEQGGADHITTAPTWNGVNLTELLNTFHASWSEVQVWYLKEASLSTTTANIVVAHTAGSPRGRIVAQVFDGVDQTTPFRTAQRTTNNGSHSAAASSLTVPSVASGDYVLDFLTVDAGSHALTVGANQTEDYDDDVAASCATGGSRQAGADGGVMSWTWTTAAPYSQIATALIPASAGTEYVDSGTVNVVLTPSAVELQAKDYSDVGTVPLALTPSSTELRERVDTSTVPVALTPSAVELREYTDANTVYVDLQPSAVEIREFVDANTVYVDLQNSGTEFITRETLDAATIPVAITPSSTELRERVDASTIYVDIQASAVELREFVDANTVPVALTPSGTEFITRETLDAATVPITFTPSSVEARESADVATVYVDVVPSSTDTRDVLDANAIYVDVTPSSTEFISSGYEDTATVAYKLTPSSTDIRDSLDSTTLYFDIQPSGVDLYDNGQNEDTGTVYVKITPIRVQEHVLEFDTLLVGTLSSSYTGALVGQSYSGSLNTKRFDGSLLDRLWSAVLNDRKWSGILGRM
jgi:hypothetical protein